MKKWQIWVLGLVVWQAITLLKKDPTLRKKVKSEPGILGKVKVVGESWLKDNKELIEDIKETDWDKTVAAVENDISYDTEKVKNRWAEQLNKDREVEWHETIRNLAWKIPDKKTLAEWVEKYKQRIIKRWDEL